MPQEPIRKTIPVTGMDCPTCTLIIEKKLKEIEGVQDVRANYMTNKVYITYDPSNAAIPAVEKTIEDLGYRVAYKKYESLWNKLIRRIKGKKT
jgi:Cu+-exporting ATPase